MATRIVYLTGEASWAHVHRLNNYGKYSIDLKLNEESQKIFDTLGLKQKVRENGTVSFRRDPDGTIWDNGVQKLAGPPRVITADGKTLTDNIGDGSTVTIKLVTYPYNNKFGKGTGSRLDVVCVDKFIPYTKEATVVVAGDEDTPKPRFPF